jgi:hypothetical protein
MVLRAQCSPTDTCIASTWPTGKTESMQRSEFWKGSRILTRGREQVITTQVKILLGPVPPKRSLKFSLDAAYL